MRCGIRRATSAGCAGRSVRADGRNVTVAVATAAKVFIQNQGCAELAGFFESAITSERFRSALAGRVFRTGEARSAAEVIAAVASRASRGRRARRTTRRTGRHAFAARQLITVRARRAGHGCSGRCAGFRRAFRAIRDFVGTQRASAVIVIQIISRRA